MLVSLNLADVGGEGCVGGAFVGVPLKKTDDNGATDKGLRI